jgi:hypothetical protein
MKEIHKHSFADHELQEKSKKLETAIDQIKINEERFRLILDSVQISVWELNLIEDTAWRRNLGRK